MTWLTKILTPRTPSIRHTEASTADARRLDQELAFMAQQTGHVTMADRYLPTLSSR